MTDTELPRIVSVDDHVIEPAHLFSTWLPAKYRERGPQPLMVAGAAGVDRLPEEAGGVGLGLPEAVLLFEEAGRALLPGPLVATHLAAGLVKGAARGRRW
ncbi:hypothetical protein SMICM304S_12094 [Streptomyces microflavus]